MNNLFDASIYTYIPKDGSTNNFFLHQLVIKMKNILSKKVVLAFFIGSVYLISCASAQVKTINWKLESITEVGGNATTVWGDPAMIEVAEGEKALEFDGKDDGVLVDNNPIAGMEEFSIEVDFKPYAGYPENKEGRFLHIQDPDIDNRRILIELRLNDQNEWYGDWFIKAENESLTLIDSTRTHPVNEWATISLIYKNGEMKGFVNGKLELSGNIRYLPISAEGKTSIGTRMNKRSWFKGAIKEIRVSSKVFYP